MTTRNTLSLCLAAAAAGAVLLATTGCTNLGYSLGSMLPKDIKTVYVPTIVNDSSEPQVETEVTRAIIRELQSDGSLRVVNESLADSVLAVTLKEFDLKPLGFDRTRNTLANEYRLTLTAEVVLRRTDNNQVIAESPRVRGDHTFPFTSDLTAARRSALPSAARDLAHDIVEQLVEAW